MDHQGLVLGQDAGRAVPWVRWARRGPAAILVTAGLLAPGLAVEAPAAADLGPPSGEAVGSIATFSDNVDSPDEIVLGADGNLWFSIDHKGYRDSIGRMAPDGSVTRFADPSLAEVESLASGVDGAVWFTASSTIGHITPDGEVTTFTGPGIGAPRGIAAGPDGAMWFTDLGGWDSDCSCELGVSIGRITPGGVVTSFTDATLGVPIDIVLGSDGNLWFTDTGRWNSACRCNVGVSIGRITPAGAVSKFSDPDVDGLTGIAAGPDGNVWFTNWSAAHPSVGRISPDGEMTSLADLDGTGPAGLATGPDGNVWFTVSVGWDDDCTCAPGRIGQVTPHGVVTWFDDDRIIDPAGIVAGPDGVMWFANRGDDSIGRVSPTGVVSTHRGTSWSGLSGIAAGPDGAMWFTNTGGHSIGRITPDGVHSTFTDPSIETPWGIAPGPDGAMWFTDPRRDSIGRITPDGTVSAFTDPRISRPQDIVLGPDRALWFTNQEPASVGRITTAGAVSVFTHPQIVLPSALAAGPDGNLWFTHGDGEIGRITPRGGVTIFRHPTIGALADIAVGPDGALWFTVWGYRDEDCWCYRPGAIGRITTAGVVSRFRVGSDPRPAGIVMGPDGAMWFTDSRWGTIGRITPAGAVSEFADEQKDDVHRPQGIAAGPDGALWFVTDYAVGRVTAASDASLPGPPSQVAATPGDGRAVVTWAPPADEGEFPVYGYTVTAAPGGATCSAIHLTMCKVPGLVNGTAYTFTVRATNAAGFGPASPPSAPVAPHRPEVWPYSDVAPSHTFLEEIVWLGDAQITGGFPDGTFRPRNLVTRGQMAALLHRLSGRPSVSLPQETPVWDVPPDHPFYEAILWALEEGIMFESAPGAFDLAAPVTRGEMASFLYGLAGPPHAPSVVFPAFSDVDSTDGAVVWLASQGVVAGFPDGRFRPGAPVTRASMAAFLQRFDARFP